MDTFISQVLRLNRILPYRIDMGYKDLLQSTEGEVVALPWIGGDRVCKPGSERTWRIEDKAKLQEYAWFSFRLMARHAIVQEPSDPAPDILSHLIQGYLIGDRLISDGIQIVPDLTSLASCSQRVYLVEPGLDRFVRISAGRVHIHDPLIYCNQEMPFGPEEEVKNAYQDRQTSVESIRNVTPALDAAFRVETWYRAEAERRRAEAERRRHEQEALLAEQERQRQLMERLGTAVGRRAMARVDFKEAARAALAVGGAEYLDHRQSYSRDEMVVTFRLNRRRFQCTCDKHTLQIIEAGICLTDSYTGEKGDSYFTLESLPGVIAEAERTGVLHVFRHVDDEDDD